MEIPHSIRFNPQKPRAIARERRWSLDTWTRKANVSMPTLKKFLSGRAHTGLKLETVEQIIRPLGRVAADGAELRPTGWRTFLPCMRGEQVGAVCDGGAK